MNKFLLSILSLLFYHSIAGQIEKCPYQALEFEELEPMWAHLTIDSTIIGYVDSTAVSQEFYIDGMEHLGRDVGSFVHGGYLYALTENKIDREISGVVAEKINLETGELEWKIIEDVRTVSYREEVLQASVENDKFILYGLREHEPDSLANGNVSFEGQLDGIYYKRVYDLETGELDYFFSPDDTDALLHEIKKGKPVTSNFYTGDSLVNFLDAREFFPAGKGFYLIREVIDTMGHLLTGPDTMVVGRFSDRLLVDANIHQVSQLDYTEEDTYLYIEQYSPVPDSDHSYGAFLTEYDKDFNVLRTVDLTAIGLDSFSQLRTVFVSDEYILLKACSNLIFSQLTICEDVCLLLDRSFNLLHQFKTVHDGEEISFLSDNSFLVIEDDEVFMIIRTLMEEGNSYLQIYKSNESGSVEPLKLLTIKETEWVGFPEYVGILDNGDFLMKITHSCFENGIKNSWHPEWFRFAAADILEGSSVLDPSYEDVGLELRPNPAKDRLDLVSEENLEGILEIYNLSGQRVLLKELNNYNSKQLDISELLSGVYNLRWTRSNSKPVIRQFMKLY